MKKILTVLIFAITFGLAMISCSDGDNSNANIPEHLKGYISSDVLTLVPNDVFMAIKVDSMSELYDTLEISSIEKLMPADVVESLRKELEFNPFSKEEIIQYLNIYPDKPLVAFVKQTDRSKPFTLDNAVRAFLLPVKDVEKFKSNFDVDEEIPVTEDGFKGSIWKIMGGHYMGFEKNGYVVFVFDTSDDKEESQKRMINFSKDIIKLPKDKSLATSKKYIGGMRNSNPNSILNFYFDLKNIKFDMSELVKSLDDPYNETFENNPFLEASKDFLDKFDYMVFDLYVSSDRMGISFYSKLEDDKSESFSGKHDISDLIKKIPGDILSFGYVRMNTEYYSEKLCKQIEETFESSTSETIKSATGKSLYEIVQMLTGEFGLSTTDTKGLFGSNVAIMIGLNKADEFKELISKLSDNMLDSADVSIEEENGIYSFPSMGFIRPVFTIKNNHLILALNESYFDRLYKSNESTADKIKSNEMKKFLNSSNTQTLFHINFDVLFDTLQFFYAEEKDMIDKAKHLLVESNLYSETKEGISSGNLEILFSQDKFLMEVYRLIFELVS